MKSKKFISRLNAVLLAATFLAGSLSCPVTTYAASKNRVTTSISVSKDTELTTKAPSLVIELEDDLAVGDVFYLELNNAEWLIDDVTIEASNIGGSATFKKTLESKDTLAVKLEEVKDETDAPLTALPADAVIRVKLASKIKKATATVKIDSNDTAVTANSSGIEFARVNTSGATAKIEEVKSMTSDGKVSDIVVEEAYEGAFAEHLDKSGNFVMRFKLANSDVEFAGVRNISVSGTKGFSGISGTARLIEDDEIEITVNGSSITGREKGAFKISGLTIEAIDDERFSGTITMDIESDAFKTMSVTIAQFSKHSLDVRVTPYDSDNKKGLIAGRSGDYKIDIRETTEDALLDGKRLEFSLEEGYFLDANTTNTKTALNVLENALSLPRELTLESVTMDDTKVVAFTASVEAEEDEIDEYSIKFPVAVDLTAIEDVIFDETEVKEETKSTTTESTESDDTESDTVAFGGGDADEEDDEKTTKSKSSKDKKLPVVKLTVSGRALAGEDIETDVAQVIQPFKVAIEEQVYKLGKKDQEGTDIVITETDAGCIDKGTIVIAFDDSDGVTFTKAPTVKVTKGDIKLGKGELIRNGNAITGVKFNVSKKSRTASEITLSDTVVTVDRTVPEGRIGILVGGSALTTGDPVASKTYAKISDTNVTDSSKQATDSLQQQIDSLTQVINKKDEGTPLTAVFTIDSNTYTVNGQAQQMDGKPYMSAAGRTMVPVKYVAYALGIDPSKILCNSGIVTILGEKDTIQFKLNSSVMLKNGAQIPMDEKATLKEGRTYIPVSFAATALGVKTTYNAETKTITFQNDAALKGATTTPTTTSPTGTSTQTDGKSTTSVEDIFNVIGEI